MNLKQIYRDQRFKPNFLSLMVNPFFFIRLRLYSQFKNLCPKLQGKIMDFGCGSKPYASLFKTTDYIGLDYAGEGHDHTNEDIDVFYDGKTIPFEDNTFDHIFSSEVFEHIFNLGQILSEINRVLKPGGSLLFSIPFSWYEHEEPIDFARYTSFGIKHLLHENGFSLKENHKCGHFVEALWQLKIAYIYHCFESKNKFLNLVFTLLFIFPLNVLGCIILWIFPKNKRYYHNNVILAVKLK